MNVRTILEEKQTDVVTIAPGAAVQHAARLMSVANVGAIVVVQAEKVIGMLTSNELGEPFLTTGMLRDACSQMH